ncbi:hypothetical protein DL93DRAFT_1565495 [Clavulina sp. PMI_390]|nr:hypothetical protein DL93DRAFT_1565495 [Clavulina sp. PMI_390]
MQSRSLWLKIIHNLLRNELIPVAALEPASLSLEDLISCATRKFRLGWQIEKSSKAPHALRHDVILKLPPIFQGHDLHSISCDATMLVPGGRWLFAMGGVGSARYLACWDLRLGEHRGLSEQAESIAGLNPAAFIKFPDAPAPTRTSSPHVFYDCVWHPDNNRLSILIGRPQNRVEVYRWDCGPENPIIKVASMPVPPEHRKITLATVGTQALLYLYPSGTRFWDWEAREIISLSPEARDKASGYDCYFTSAGTRFACLVSSNSEDGKLNIRLWPLSFLRQYRPQELSIDSRRSKFLVCDVPKIRHDDKLDVLALQPMHVSPKEMMMCFRIHFRTYSSFVYVSVSSDLEPALVFVTDLNTPPPPTKDLINFWLSPSSTFAIPRTPRQYIQAPRDPVMPKSSQRFRDRILRRSQPSTSAPASPSPKSSADPGLQVDAITPGPISLPSEAESHAFDFVIGRRPLSAIPEAVGLYRYLTAQALNTSISFPALRSDGFKTVRCLGFCGRSGTWVFNKPVAEPRQEDHRRLSFTILKYD